MIVDRRRWDFSIIDDEFTDDPRISPAARAAYLSIVRHARRNGYTDDPADVLMCSSGLKAPLSWRRSRDELVRLGYIAVERRGSKRPPRIVILPVAKARTPALRPPTVDTTTGRGHKMTIQRSSRDPSHGHKMTMLLSETSERREKSACAWGIEEAWKAFRKERGRDPDNRAELAAFQAARGGTRN